METSIENRIQSLENSNSKRKGLLMLFVVILILAIVSVLFYMLSLKKDTDNTKKYYDEITVGRLNIAGPDSINRLIMSYKMPSAPFQGVKLERTVPPGLAGMIFCAPNGDEVGGIGVSGTENGGHALSALDYRNVPLEAVGMVTRYNKEEQGAGFVVMDNPTKTIDINKLNNKDENEIKKLQSMMIDRISLGVYNNDAALTIKDREGNVRIVIGVDKEGNPRIEQFDSNGNKI